MKLSLLCTGLVKAKPVDLLGKVKRGFYLKYDTDNRS